MSDDTGFRNDGLRGGFLRRLLTLALAAVPFGLMMMTVVDVIGRDLFDAPIKGGYELSGLILMLLFFCALPFATAGAHHITVTLIDGIVPPAGRARLDAAASVISAVLLLVLAYFVMLKGLSSIRYMEATMFLSVPLGPFSLLAAASLAITGLILLWRAWRGLRGDWQSEPRDDV